MISTIITAGGVSRRFGPKNKLLEKIDGKSVIERTISAFLDFSDEIIIPALDETREFIEKTPIFDAKKIFFAKAGVTRQKSVQNALKACCHKGFVLIHDGARPFVSVETIKSTIEAVKIHKAVCVGKMATDTIKIVDSAGFIQKTIPRDAVFQAQTPQAFEFSLIFEAHEKFSLRNDFSDDSSMAEALGHKVFALVCTGANKKITTLEDL